VEKESAAALKSLRSLGMRAAVKEHLRSRLADFRCPQHGEPLRLVGEGEALTLEGCCPAAVEAATRTLSSHN
jgi:hypothetical protein